MQDEKATFQVPSFAQNKAYDFDAVAGGNIEVYEELSAIAEELEKCRLRNC